MPHEFAILQAARLKGRLTPELAVSSSGLDPESVATELDRLREAGFVAGDARVRITPAGREHLKELAATERADVDDLALKAFYEEFDDHNTRLKTIVSNWQMIGDTPNEHTDAEYDRGVIENLVDLHTGFRPLVERIVAVAPRLEQYLRRFDHAITQIHAGDTSFVARPIIDSYHTVWFEFHEELIGLLGLSREEEAAAGRAV